jgi:hypothetical protein
MFWTMTCTSAVTASGGTAAGMQAIKHTIKAVKVKDKVKEGTSL